VPEQIPYTIMGPALDVWLAADVVRHFHLKDVRALRRLIDRGHFPRPRTGMGKVAFWTGADMACFLGLAGRFLAKKEEKKPAQKAPPTEKT
jgi:hypothetical protein